MQYLFRSACSPPVSADPGVAAAAFEADCSRGEAAEIRPPPESARASKAMIATNGRVTSDSSGRRPNPRMTRVPGAPFLPETGQFYGDFGLGRNARRAAPVGLRDEMLRFG